MKKLLHINLFFMLSIMLSFLVNLSMLARRNKSKKSTLGNVVQQNIDEKSEKIVSFNFKDEELVDVINYLAAQKEVNIVLPVGGLPVKVTFNINEKLTLGQAWDLLYTVLDVAGYSMAEREQNTFAVVRTNKDIIREELPVYIGVEPEELPDTDVRIRYLYFLSNIKVSEEAESELKMVLKDLLPQETSTFLVEPTSNAIIIIAKSKDIKAVMRIIKLLERTTFTEKMELIKLQHVTASTVANLFNESILKMPERNRYGVDTKKPSEATYFSKHVKVFAEDRINSLIVLGREQAVERVKDFVRKYIDVPLESGQSVLHIYQLQYLDTVEFEPVLKQIVEAAPPAATGQAQVTGPSKQAGVERYFEGVIIKSDTPEAKAEGETRFGGGNKLIIAARYEDWKRIKSLIEKLDTPQPQVIIQVLVADLTLDDIRSIGSLMRNPQAISLPGCMDAQAANIGNVVVNSYENPTTIAADLLRNYYSDQAGTVATTDAAAQYSYADQQGADVSTVKSTLVSLNDCGNGWTWAILQFLKDLDYKKVISLPHVIAVNNKKAEVVIGQERLVQDEAVGSASSVTTTRKWIKADLVINLTPRIAYGTDVRTLSLDIEVTINDFQSTTNYGDADKNTRNVKTTALLNSGEVIALGGLLKLEDTNSLKQTPVLGQIPILGYLFKNKRRSTPKTNLTVFIMPTIIQPKLRGGMGDYTKDYIKLTKQYTKEGSLFDSLKDPITRWFFEPGSKVDQTIEEFVSEDELKKEEIVFSNEVDSSKIKSVSDKKNIRRKKKISQKQILVKNNKHTKSDSELKKLLAKEENPLLQS